MEIVGDAGSNITTGIHARETLYDAQFIIFITNTVATAVAMFGLGCNVKLEDLSGKNQFMMSSVVIGFVLTIFIQPLIGYAIASSMLGLQTGSALTLLALACCPCSPYSTVLIYYSDGLVATGLMTSLFSTALAVGIIPFMFGGYVSTWSEGYYAIPSTADIALVEALIFFPAALGQLFKHLAGVKPAKVASRLCSLSFLVAFAYSTYVGTTEPNNLRALRNWRFWTGACGLSLSGLLSGLLLSVATNLPHDVGVAASFVTGSPNWLIASHLARFIFSDDIDNLENATQMAFVCSVAVPTVGLLWVLLNKAYVYLSILIPNTGRKKTGTNYNDDGDEYAKKNDTSLLM